MLVYRDLCGAEAIFLEAGVLHGAGGPFALELTWLRDREEPYNLGECEFHLAFTAEDYEATHAKHEAMGCICFENPAMGIYFISDPDGYWIEVVPARR